MPSEAARYGMSSNSSSPHELGGESRSRFSVVSPLRSRLSARSRGNLTVNRDLNSGNRTRLRPEVVEAVRAVDIAAEFAELARAEGLEPAGAALAWAAQQPGVSTVIPGARHADQARSNAAAGDVPALSPEFLDAVEELYDSRIRAQVHSRW
ncbi:aldo/keto reductase [Brevibacterium samyangense]|uniref:aldo/keto reductase n=1 Tax=Brevibacterium samyangense TaxID=366888 RepID=UPI0031D43017